MITDKTILNTKDHFDKKNKDNEYLLIKITVSIEGLISKNPDLKKEVLQKLTTEAIELAFKQA